MVWKIWYSWDPGILAVSGDEICRIIVLISVESAGKSRVKVASEDLYALIWKPS